LIFTRKTETTKTLTPSVWVKKKHMKKKKIAIIGTNGLPGRYGGWDQLLNHLTSSLSDKYEIIVYTSSYNAVKGLKEYNGAKLTIIPLKANGFQSVLYDGVSMLDACLKYDILLVLGTSGCVFLPLTKVFNKKIILNPDGAEWKRGKWNYLVKSFLKLSEKLGVILSDIVVADNIVIQDYIKEKYSKNSVLIEYGGDHVINESLSLETAQKYDIERKKYAFKVCRIEPENNIDLILEAFKDAKLKLILIGNWAFSKYGVDLKDKYKSFDNLVLLDPIYDQRTLDELRSNCGVYVHGHSVGGTNPSLVEAMNLGLCCAVFDVNYNRETTENAALYFSNIQELKNLTSDFLNNKINSELIGSNLKSIANKRYTWESIINKYEQLFK
jgi:glycosyltransferase involved in cell wall biosynthesis